MEKFLMGNYDVKLEIKEAKKNEVQSEFEKKGIE